MIFRKALASELDLVLAMYKSVVGTEFCTWDDIYPGMEEVANDFESGGLYVMEDDDQIVGAVSVVPENELDDIDLWKVKAPNARELARVVVAIPHRGRGIAYEMVTNILPLLKNAGCLAVHLLVARENTPAFKTYQKAGFSVLGECNRYDIDFYICEKLL